jgi:hypothetical protein
LFCGLIAAKLATIAATLATQLAPWSALGFLFFLSCTAAAARQAEAKFRGLLHADRTLGRAAARMGAPDCQRHPY